MSDQFEAAEVLVLQGTLAAVAAQIDTAYTATNRACANLKRLRRPADVEIPDDYGDALRHARAAWRHLRDAARVLAASQAELEA